MIARHKSGKLLKTLVLYVKLLQKLPKRPFNKLTSIKNSISHFSNIFGFLQNYLCDLRSMKRPSDAFS